jgi:hypothetical protein
VPEYDAFGREIGEDTLAGLGGRDATVRPAPVPSPAPAPEAPRTETPPPEASVFTTPDAPLRRVRERRGRGLGCLVGLVILAAVVAGPIIAVVSIVGSASDTIDGVTGVLDDIATIDPQDAPETPDVPVPPVGIEGRSMIAPANVGAAFKRLKGDGVKRVSQITLRPDRIDAGTVKGRRQRDVLFTFDGSVQRGDARPANQALGTVALADLDPKAAARLVRNCAKRFRVRERGINYVIAMNDIFAGDGGHRWTAYFKNGIYVEGDERGRVVRRIS